MLRQILVIIIVAAALVSTAPALAEGLATTTPLPDGVYGHAMVASSGYLYSIGGIGNSTGITTNVYYSTAQPSGPIDPWLATTPLPEEVADHSAVASNGYIYVLGGFHTQNFFFSNAVYYSKINPGGSPCKNARPSRGAPGPDGLRRLDSICRWMRSNLSQDKYAS